MKTTPTRTHCRFGKNGQIMRNSRRKEARKKKKKKRREKCEAEREADVEMEKRGRNEAKEIKRKTKEGRRNGIETTAWGLSARVPFERAARLNEHHSTAQCRLTPLGAAVILVEALKRPTAFSWRCSWCREDNALSLSFASVLQVMYAREQPSKLGTIAFIRI